MTDPSHSLTLLISRAKKDMIPKSPLMSLNSSFILHKCSANPVLHSSTIRPCLTPPPSAPGKRGKVAEIMSSSSLIWKLLVERINISFYNHNTTLLRTLHNSVPTVSIGKYMMN